MGLTSNIILTKVLQVKGRIMQNIRGLRNNTVHSLILIFYISIIWYSAMTLLVQFEKSLSQTQLVLHYVPHLLRHHCTISLLLNATNCNNLNSSNLLRCFMIVQSYPGLMSTLTLKSNTVLTQSIITLAHHVFNQIKKQNKQTGFKK